MNYVNFSGKGRKCLVAFFVLILAFSFSPAQAHASSGFFQGIWCNITGFFGFICEISVEAVAPGPEVSVVTPTPLPKPTEYQMVNSVNEIPAENNNTTVEEHNTYTTNPTTVVYQTIDANEISDSTFLDLFHKLINLIGQNEQQGSVVSRNLFDKQIDKVFDRAGENIDNVQEEISTLSTDMADSFITDLLTVSGNTAINGNATVDGDLNVIGTISAGVLNVDALSSGGALVAPYFSATSTVATSTFMGAVGIGTTSPNEKLTVIGNTYLNGGLTLTGVFKDSTSATGTNGMILKSTGSATEWMATSTLGIAISDTTGTLAATRGGTGLSSITQSQLLIGATGNTWTQVATSSLGLGDGTFTGLSDTQNSLTANRLIFANSGGTALTDSANLTFNGTNLGIGNNNPQAKLDITGSTDATQLIVRANSTQSNTNPLIKLLTSTGGEFMRIHTDDITNLFIGSLAGNSNTVTGVTNEGIYNTFIGRSAGTSNTVGWHNTAVGAQSLVSNTTGIKNTALGYYSLINNTVGNYNTALGNGALHVNEIGNLNVAIGHHSMSEVSTSTSETTAVGAFALTYNSSGVSNSALGYATLGANTTGSYNTAVGHNSLSQNTTGSFNSGVGKGTLYFNTTGSNGTAIGYSALISNTTGSNNTALGMYALYANTTGSQNTAIGNSSGRYIANGVTANATSSNSLYLGYDTRALNSGDINEIVIGHSAIGNGSNSVTLGNTSITKTILQNGVGIGVTAPTASLHASGTVRFESFGAGTLQTDANGNLSVSSDERLKYVMGNFSPGLNVVLALQPIQYKWLKETGYDNETLYSGFSAQNVQSVLPEAVGEDKRGFLTLSDRPIMAAIVNAIKELWNTVTNNQKRIEALENGVANQDMKRIEDLEAEVSKLKEMMQQQVIYNSKKDSKSNITEDVSSTTSDALEINPSESATESEETTEETLPIEESKAKTTESPEPTEETLNE